MVDVRCRGVPGAHEPAATGADESVKLPPLRPQSIDRGAWQFGKDRVGLAREEELDLWERPQFRFEILCHLVGVGGVSQPGAVLEHPDPGGGNEAHFTGELAALLAAVI